MKKIAMLLSIAIMLSLAVPFFCAAAGADEPAAGTPENPIQIATSAELLDFKALLESKPTGEKNICAKLTQDIDMTSIEWEPIGGYIGVSGFYTKLSEATREYYSGVFDGDGHTISIKRATAQPATGIIGRPAVIALFNAIGAEGVLKNLTINVNFDYVEGTNGLSYAAGAAVYNWGTIERVTVTGGISGREKIAGISLYSLSSSSSSDPADKWDTHPRILYCVNAADLFATNGEVAGISIGCTGIIKYCANRGHIQANNQNSNAGFASPDANGGNMAVIEDCYNAGDMDSEASRMC